MAKQTTVTINGVRYDAHTGMRLDARTPKTAAVPALSVHKKPAERSTTLKRAHVHQPERKTPVKPVASDIKKSPLIRKFAADTAPAKTAKSGRTVSDIAPVSHPTHHRAVAAIKARRPAAVQPKSGRELKHHAVHQAMKRATPATKPPRTSFVKRHPRIFSAGTAGLAIVLLAGWLTYVSLPVLSLRMAAAQAGVDAHLPSYQPSGYRLSGPVTYAQGSVNLHYDANASQDTYTITQSKSDWDSTAVLDNIVKKAAGNDYTTYTEKGLTVYLYGSNAAWVNGGILHVIKGSDNLANDQLQKIALSM